MINKYDSSVKHVVKALKMLTQAIKKHKPFKNMIIFMPKKTKKNY